MINYHLYQQLHTHEKEVRCVDALKDLLVTGSSDLTVCLYARTAGNYQSVNRVTIFDSYIYAVKINPYGLGHQAIAVGCKDSKIYLLDSIGNPTSILYGHTNSISSLSWLNENTLVSGSWDATAIIWQVKYAKPLHILKGHSHAVTVLAIGTENLVVTGSQDGNLNYWEATTGKLIRKKEKAHGDIVREIVHVPNIGLVTCSNDETVKLWTFDGNHLHTYLGHTSFVFSVKPRGTEYISGGYDRTVRVWEGYACIQTIAQPGTVWNIAVNDLDDIIVAGSDAVVRVYSRDGGRRASEEYIKALHQECLKTSAEKSGMTEYQLVKLPHVDKMPLHRGKKEGYVKIFRNGNIPQAYIWKTNHWYLVGYVITQNEPKSGAPKGKKYYPGDEVFPEGEYDYLFDVDDESGVPKVIPFNNGANALVEAEKYCKRYGLQKGYIYQIRKFLTANSSPVPTSAMNESKEYVSGALEVIPQTNFVEFIGVSNSAGLKNKLFEFNETMEEKLKLNATEKGHVERIITLLENEKGYHQWQLDFKYLDAFKKLLKWPEKNKLPVWDLLRNYLKHYQSETLFSGLDRGMDVVGPLCQTISNKETGYPLSGLILRVLANCFIQNTPMNCMVSNAEVILQTVGSACNKGFTGKNFGASLSGLLLNYSSGFVQRPVEKQDVLVQLLRMIENRLPIDNYEQSQQNLLAAVGNLIHRYPDLKKMCQFVKPYLQPNPVSRDLGRLLG